MNILLNLALFLSFFGQVLNQNTEVHPFHISKTIVEYNANSRTLQASVHIFLDDLEETIITVKKEDINYQTSHQYPQADSLIQDYVMDMLLFEKNGKSFRFNPVGQEVSEDHLGLWVYLESETINDKEVKLVIQNKLLMESFSDQKNIVTLNILEDSHYFLFRTKSQTESVSFSIN